MVKIILQLGATVKNVGASFDNKTITFQELFVPIFHCFTEASFMSKVFFIKKIACYWFALKCGTGEFSQFQNNLVTRHRKSINS